MSGKNERCLRIGTITAINSEMAYEHIQQIVDEADVIELRLDYWEKIDLEVIASLRKKIRLPVIFTLRSIRQGGHCIISEAERLNKIYELAALEPNYFDIEYDVSKNWLNNFRDSFPQIKIIGSFHDFESTPSDLSKLFLRIANPVFDLMKISVFAHNILDTLRLMIFTRSMNSLQPLIAFAMGEAGQISRILAPIMGSFATYGCVDIQSQAAPGQLTLKEMNNIYKISKLNSQTKIYALLGNPVDQSPGHIVHNRAFSLLNKNAVYVKCHVEVPHLEQAFSLIQQLPFAGFSVTIPHKETIVQCVNFLEGDAAQFHIVNTLKKQTQGWLGYNTDAVGGGSVLAENIELTQKRCLILGAGGSAKALAFALLSKDVSVTLCNRTLSRAQVFVEQFGGSAMDFDTLFSMTSFPYDIIINTLPKQAYDTQCGEWKIPSTKNGIAMEIVLKPLETLFVQSARLSGWSCLTGDQLFKAQGIRQLKIWFDLQDVPLIICKSFDLDQPFYLPSSRDFDQI